MFQIKHHLPYSKKSQRWAPVMHGSTTTHIQHISHAEQQRMLGLWVEKDEVDASNSECTPAFVLCHVTNASKAVFQPKHCLSLVFQEKLKWHQLSPTLTWGEIRGKWAGTHDATCCVSLVCFFLYLLFLILVIMFMMYYPFLDRGRRGG